MWKGPSPQCVLLVARMSRSLYYSRSLLISLSRPLHPSTAESAVERITHTHSLNRHTNETEGHCHYHHSKPNNSCKWENNCTYPRQQKHKSGKHRPDCHNSIRCPHMRASDHASPVQIVAFAMSSVSRMRLRCLCIFTPEMVTCGNWPSFHLKCMETAFVPCTALLFYSILLHYAPGLSNTWVR